MKVISLNYKRINSELNGVLNSQTRITSNLDIINLNEVSSKEILIKGKLINCLFSFIIEYSPNVAKIELVGNLLVSLEENEAEQILLEWKNKKIPSEFRANLINHILRRISIKALTIEETFGLPPHIPFPFIKNSLEK